MKFIGAHVSIAGGVENAPLNARAIGATAFAMFTKNQRQWNAPPCTGSAAAAFRANCAAGGYDHSNILAHDSYLINLGQPDPAKRAAAVKAFADELERCRLLGVKLLNFHPGSSLKAVSDDEDITLIAESVRQALDQVPDVTAVFENTAGQGSNLGWNFEQLRTMIDRTGVPERCGVCLDTCHAFASGMDLSTEAGYEKFWADFERIIGLGFLKGMHLNDAKGVCGGRLDRHESLGRGAIGIGCFERLLQDPRTDGIPLILETPDENLWSEEIARLKSFAGC
ncbi:MAG: deoxyribonuclease IV [Lentisphaeria bacterium]|nr:deoxyribonuclease IV [Lentisphaeria bacterium]